jgi:Putative MetA-pathway of phenol degradation
VNVNLNLSLSGQADLVVLSPTYTFATPVLGGQFSISVASWFGKSSASIAGTLTAAAGPIVATRTGVLSDSLISYGDVVPTATLRWNQGVNNYMVYVTGDIPAGDYSPTRLSNLGIGMVRSMPAAPTPISIQRPETNFRPQPASPTISRIPTRSIKTASISTSTGAPRISSRSRFSSALPDMPTSSSPTTPRKIRFSAASGRVFSVSVRRSDIPSR